MSGSDRRNFGRPSWNNGPPGHWDDRDRNNGPPPPKRDAPNGGWGPPPNIKRGRFNDNTSDYKQRPHWDKNREQQDLRGPLPRGGERDRDHHLQRQQQYPRDDRDGRDHRSGLRGPSSTPARGEYQERRHETRSPPPHPHRRPSPRASEGFGGGHHHQRSLSGERPPRDHPHSPQFRHPASGSASAADFRPGSAPAARDGALGREGRDHYKSKDRSHGSHHDYRPKSADYRSNTNNSKHFKSFREGGDGKDSNYHHHRSRSPSIPQPNGDYHKSSSRPVSIPPPVSPVSDNDADAGVVKGETPEPGEVVLVNGGGVSQEQEPGQIIKKEEVHAEEKQQKPRLSLKTKAPVADNDDQQKPQRSNASPKTADEIVEGINLADQEVEALEEELVELELQLQRQEGAAPRAKKALDKVKGASPAAPEFSEEQEDLEEAISSDSEPEEKEPAVKKRRGRPPKNNRKNNKSANRTDTTTGDDKEPSPDREGSEDSENLLPAAPALPPAKHRLLTRLGALINTVESDDAFKRIVQQSKDLGAASRSQFNCLIPQSLLAKKTESALTEPAVDGAKKELEKLLTRRLTGTEAPPGIQTTLKREFKQILRAHLLAAIDFRTRYEKWRKKELVRLQQKRVAEAAVAAAAAAGLPVKEGMRRTASVLSGGRRGEASMDPPTSPVVGRNSSRGRSGDIVRSDLEERQAIATLQAIDLVKKMVELPPMGMFAPRAARWVTGYQDKNRLVEDPLAANDQLKFIRPWSEEEVSIFAEKFLAYHKDFQKIAPFLPGRTVPEIVRLYYAVQHTEEFELTRKKYQLKKRREKAEENAESRRHSTMMLNLPMPASMPANHDLLLLPGENTTATRKGLGPRNTSRSSGLGGGADSESEPAAVAAAAPIKGGRGRGRGRGRGGRPPAVPVYPEPPAPGKRGPRSSRAPVTSFDNLVALVEITAEEAAMAAATTAPLVDSPGFGSPSVRRGHGNGGYIPPYEIDSGNESDYEFNPNPKQQSGITSGTRGGGRGGGGGRGHGRGRLPNAETDQKFLQAVQLYGRNWELIAGHMGNRTAAGAKGYWERHRVRLGLDALVVDGGGGDWVEPVSAATVAAISAPAAVVVAEAIEVSWWQQVFRAANNKEEEEDAEAATVASFVDAMVTAVENAVENGVEGPLVLDSMDIDDDGNTSNTDKLLSLVHQVPETERTRIAALLQPGAALHDVLNHAPRALELAELVSNPPIDCSTLSCTVAELCSHLAHAIDYYNTTIATTAPHQRRSAPSAAATNGGGRRGKLSVWSEEEKHALIEAYKQYGRNFDEMRIAVPSKTLSQIRNFYQNYRAKLFDHIQLPPGAIHPGGRGKRKSESAAASPGSAAAAGRSPISPAAGLLAAEMSASTLTTTADGAAAAEMKLARVAVHGAGGTRGRRGRKRGRPPATATAAASSAFPLAQQQQQQPPSVDQTSSPAAAAAAMMQQHALMMQMMAANTNASGVTAAQSEQLMAAMAQQQEAAAAISAGDQCAAGMQEQMGKLMEIMQNTVQMNTLLMMQIQQQQQEAAAVAGDDKEKEEKAEEQQAAAEAKDTIAGVGEPQSIDPGELSADRECFPPKGRAFLKKEVVPAAGAGAAATETQVAVVEVGEEEPQSDVEMAPVVE